MKSRLAPLLALPFLLWHHASAETIPLEQAPAAVQKTIKERLANASIEDVDSDQDEGQVIYTITFTLSGQDRELTLSESGRILSGQVFLKDLSPALQMAIQRITPPDAIEHIEKVLEETPEYYSVEWKAKDGRSHTFDLWESGKIKSIQLTLDEAPATVRAGIQKLAGSSTVRAVAKSFEEVDVQYIATLVREGAERELTVSEAGELLRLEISLAETPEPVQKTIAATIGQGTFSSVDKVMDDGHVQYEVQWTTKEGAAHSFTVLALGKLLNLRVSLEETPPIVRAAITREAGGDKLKEINKSFDDGVAYDVTITRGGHDRDFSIGEDGQLRRIEMALPEVPPVVQKGILKFTDASAIVSIDRTVEDDRTQYNVEWKSKDGAIHSFSLFENSGVKSMSVTLAETTPAANATIVQEIGTATLKEIAQTYDDNAVKYDVTIIRGEQERDFTVAAFGKLERRQLFLEELAAPAQAGIKGIVASGTILRIDQVFDRKKGGFRMEVESLIQGKRYDFSVGANGQFLGADKS
jgi:uncharacterized membrane protein YkoI